MLRDRGEAKQVLPNHQNGLPALQELRRHPDSGARLQLEYPIPRTLARLIRLQKILSSPIVRFSYFLS